MSLIDAAAVSERHSLQAQAFIFSNVCCVFISLGINDNKLTRASYRALVKIVAVLEGPADQGSA
jgi:hypothetical protein